MRKPPSNGQGHGGTRDQTAVRVVVVDDFEPFLELAREVILSTPGFEPTREVSSGVDALAVVDEVEPELMIIDVHMPGMSGIELARRVRAAHPAVVVVLISARDLGDIAAEARDCGAAGIIPKQSFGPEKLTRLWREHRHAAR